MKKELTYADAADRLTKKIGKLEKDLNSSDRFAKNTAKEMLPRLKQKLDMLFQEQENQKQMSFQKDMQKIQMKYGGDLTKYGIGGDVAQVGGKALSTFGMLAGSIPGVGTAVGAAAQGVGDGLQQIGEDVNSGQAINWADVGKEAAFGAAKGATGVAGNMLIGAGESALDGATGGTLDPSRERIINPEEAARQSQVGNINQMIGTAGELANQFMAYGGTINRMAYGGRLPKMQPGGPIKPNPNEEWADFLARAQAEGIPAQDKWDPATQTIIPGALNMYNDPNNMAVSAQYTKGDIRGERVASDIIGADGKPVMVNANSAAPTPINPNSDYAKRVNQYAGDDSTRQEDGTYLTEGPAYPKQSEYNQPANTSTNNNNNNQQYQPEPLKPWQNALYNAATYAPSAYNIAKGLQKPQVLDHEEFQNPYESQAMGLMANRRYNVEPQLDMNRSSYRNMQENIKGATGGNAGSYLSNIGGAQLANDKSNAIAWGTKQNYDNQYKGEQAQFMGGMGAQRAKTKLGVQDINDKNKAARDAHMAEGLRGLSGAAQNTRMMRNLGDADWARAQALGYMFPDYAPQFNPNPRNSKGPQFDEYTYNT